MPKLKPINNDGNVQVIIETPKGHRNKYKYLPKAERFELSGVLSSGLVFPYDFGFIPGTEADDGDPIDVLILMDEPAFPGCIVPARLIGVLEATQQQPGKKPERNDRLIAVPVQSHEHADLKEIEDLPKKLLSEIAHFFVSYNEIKNVKFTPIEFRGRKEADRLLKKSVL